MPELLLVRHAPTSWTGSRYCGRTDRPLSEAGLAAAARLADALIPSLPPALRIVSSPLLRARETAGVFEARMPEARLDLDDRWSETDFGVAEGLTYAELERVAPDLAARIADGDPAIDWPEGEPSAALAARVAAALDDLAATGRPTLVVSHGGPIRIAIALLTDRPASEVRFPAPGSAWRRPGGLPISLPDLRRSEDPGPPR